MVEEGVRRRVKEEKKGRLIDEEKDKDRKMRVEIKKGERKTGV